MRMIGNHGDVVRNAVDYFYPHHIYQHSYCSADLVVDKSTQGSDPVF
jgi:hypothetical protein